MDETAFLAKVKETKRKAHFTYAFSRNLYLTKIANTHRENIAHFKEALQALDAMYALYTALRYQIHQQPLAVQIVFVEKWQMYMECIETLLAQKTKDQELILNSQLHASAQEKAIALFQEFQKHVSALRP